MYPLIMAVGGADINGEPGPSKTNSSLHSARSRVALSWCIDEDPHKPLRDDVRLLGTLLGQTIEEQDNGTLQRTVVPATRLSSTR